MDALIFGGAFDPPHSEHINILKAAIKSLNKDLKIIIVPTYAPPHKSRAKIDFETRCALIDLALKDEDFEYEISDIEYGRGDKNFASEVLEQLNEKYTNLYYLIGLDSLLAFETWYKPQKICNLAILVVCGRGGYSGIDEQIEHIKKKYNARIVKVDYEGENISSTLIRTRLRLHLPVHIKGQYLIKPYFTDLDEILEDLNSMQTEDLFLHSRAVAYRAVEINSFHNLGLDNEKVLMAGLLHDNAKQRLSLDGFDIPQDAVGTPVLHQFLGSFKAKRDFNIQDEEILSAINYHTTGKANMITLEKLIYSADLLSEDRPDIQKLLAVMKNDFEIGFKAALSSSYFYVLSKKRGMHPLTQEAFDYYIKETR